MGSAAQSRAETTEQVARAYFAAVAARDPEAMAACWKPGGIDRIHGQAELTAPDEITTWFGELFAAFPDLDVEVLSATADEQRCAIRWRLTATFAGPGRFQGFAPTGARVSLEAVDVLQVADGQVVGNDAYLDGADVARQLGVLPPAGSGQERGMASLVNARTALARRLQAAPPEQIAEGVWVVRGGLPRKLMNVYLLREDDGRVTMFDAGVASMAPALAADGARMGGLRRIVLGHGHPDHRGAAAAIDAEVFCHAADRADAEGDGGVHYMDFSKLDLHGRLGMPRLLRSWDGGPVKIAGTIAEGEDVAGFEVVHVPGHAPGMIALWRESDRLLLSTDAFYTLDPQSGISGRTRVPHPAFNQDHEQARRSLEKLAALRPATAWSGHGRPLTGDVAGELLRAAEAG